MNGWGQRLPFNLVEGCRLTSEDIHEVLQPGRIPLLLGTRELAISLADVRGLSSNIASGKRPACKFGAAMFNSTFALAMQIISEELVEAEEVLKGARLDLAHGVILSPPLSPIASASC